jgi:hypothetical protein
MLNTIKIPLFVLKKNVFFVGGREKNEERNEENAIFLGVFLTTFSHKRCSPAKFY